jgi:hypothetical protein
MGECVVSRNEELLIKAAKEIEQDGNVISDYFMAQNSISHDEGILLSRQLAIGARIMAQALADPGSIAGRAMLITMMEM